MKELSGRVAVVTGAASGIGLAMARRFAEEGMKVVISDVEETSLTAAVKSFEQEGGPPRASCAMSASSPPSTSSGTRPFVS
ncbi:MAG: SDR family NAD(P)-dependent oxidoreductase [bacterium]|nr:hypothetical protein [Deltaproteobacteria bacterium]MCP4903577.1 SDR family NAD(P)-dependent oxidoreductase [bacterium]